MNPTPRPMTRKATATTVSPTISLMALQMFGEAVERRRNAEGKEPPRTRFDLDVIAGDVVRRSKLPKTTALPIVRYHLLPRTGQGVRNLDVLAPAEFRNGHRFRYPKNFEAICPHEEPPMLLDSEIISEEVENVLRDYDACRQKWIETVRRYTIHFRVCDECGTEVPV